MPRTGKGLPAGSKIPDFALQGADGRTYTNKQYLGQPFLIYFLRGTW